MINRLFRLLNAEGNSTAAAAPAAPAAAPAPEAASPDAAAPAAASATPATPPAAPAAPKSEEKIAAKFAEMAKRERAMAARERALMEREKKIADLRELAKTDPDRAAGELGLTYEEWTKRILNAGKGKDKVDEVKERLDRLEAERKAEAERNAKAAQEAAIAEQRQMIMDHVAENSETFELIEKTQSYSLVMEVMTAFAERTRQEGEERILSVQEACDLTEKYLDDQLTQTLSWKKVQAKVKPAAAPAQPAEGTKEAPKIDTLTQTMGTAPRTVATSAPQPKILSRDAEIAEAAKLLKFTKA